METEADRYRLDAEDLRDGAALMAALGKPAEDIALLLNAAEIADRRAAGSEVREAA
jgi:hypothetical protein